MFHNPSVLTYYAEARHRDDLSRLPTPDRIAFHDEATPASARFPLARLFARFRLPRADAPPAVFPRHGVGA